MTATAPPQEGTGDALRASQAVAAPAREEWGGPSPAAGGVLRAGGWAVLALLGQVAALQLVQAGPTVRYQHFLSPGRLLHEAPPWALSLLALQLVGVGAAVLPRAPAWVRWLRAELGWARLALGVAFCALASAALSHPADYVVEVAFAALLQLVALANAVLAVGALPDGTLARIRRWWGREHIGGSPRGPAGIDGFVLVAAAGVTVTAALLALVAYQRFPHVPDEVGYLLQARYFARGWLMMPAPPVPPAFDVDLMTYDPGGWYSAFPPGWPAALALGVRLGAPWLVNPLLGGISIVLAYLFLRELYAPPTARLATLLLAASPWQLFLAMSLMSHTLALVLALVAALGTARARRGGSPAWPWVAGAATGVVSSMRPLEGLALAALLGLWLLPARGRRFRFAPAASLTLGALVAGMPALWYNARLTGQALTFPVMAYFDRYHAPGVNSLGFGPNRGFDWGSLHPGVGHTLFGAALNAAMNTAAMNVELFGWATGSLFLAVLFVLSRRLQYPDRLMLAAIAVIVGVHTFYWFSGGPDFGARYWYLIIVPCVALTARGVERLEEWAAADVAGELGRSATSYAPAVGRGWRPGAAVALTLLLTTGALLAFVPWRASDRYRNYRGMGPGLRELAETHHFGRDLVLVQGRRHPDYAAAAVLNPLDLRADTTIYAWDRGPDVRSALARAYPDRRIWIVAGPTVAGGKYRLIAGPLPPGVLQPGG